MQKSSAWGGQLPAKKSLLSIAIATALFSAAAPSHALGLTTVTGVVAGSYFTPPVNSNIRCVGDPLTPLKYSNVTPMA